MLNRLKTDFRLSIITLLGTSAFLGITPFAAIRFWQGNVFAGLIDTSILVFICAGMAYAWITGDTRRSGVVLAVIACAGPWRLWQWLERLPCFGFFPAL